MNIGRPDWWRAVIPGKTHFGQSDTYWYEVEWGTVPAEGSIYICEYTVPENRILHLSHIVVSSKSLEMKTVSLRIGWVDVMSFNFFGVQSINYSASATHLVAAGQTIKIKILNYGLVDSFCSATLNGYEEIRT